MNGSARLTDRGLGLLGRHAPQLQGVELQHCPGVTNGGVLDLVSRCVDIQHLDVTGKQRKMKKSWIMGRI